MTCLVKGLSVYCELKRATQNTKMSAERETQWENESDNERYCVRPYTALICYNVITEKGFQNRQTCHP
jgi:hypothetical protein